MALPDLVMSMTSPVPSESRTSRIRSPSFTPDAIIPRMRGFANSASLVRFITPFSEMNTTNRAALRSSAASMVTMASPRSAWVRA